MIKDAATGWFAIDGKPIGPGYGLDVDNDNYSCYSGMTTRTIHMTKDDIASFHPIHQEELHQIQQKLEDYQSKYDLHDFFGYCGSEFIGWIISGCDLPANFPHIEAIQSICISRGRMAIEELTKYANELKVKHQST